MLWRNNTYLRALQSAALRPFQVTEITTKTWRCNKYATGSPEGPSLRIWQRWLVLTTSMTGHSWGTPYGMAVKVLLEMINQERRFTPNMNTLLNELGSTESKEKKKKARQGTASISFCSLVHPDVRRFSHELLKPWELPRLPRRGGRCLQTSDNEAVLVSRLWSQPWENS